MQLFIGKLVASGTRWSSAHDRLLIDLAEAGATKEDIAVEVKRTPLGVYERAKTLGVRFKRHLAWTTDEDEILRAGIAAGKSRKQTAVGLPNRSLDSMSMRASRLGIGFTPGARNDIWEIDDRLERALKMWADGKSGRDIAKALNCDLTRSAIIAKMHRRGMKRASVPKPKREAPVRKPKPVKPPKPRAPFALQDYKTLRAFKASEGWLPPTPANDVARVPLEELKAKHCRWIAGDPKKVARLDPLYCGHDRQPGLAYCARHSARAYRCIADVPRHFFGE